VAGLALKSMPARSPRVATGAPGLLNGGLRHRGAAGSLRSSQLARRRRRRPRPVIAYFLGNRQHRAGVSGQADLMTWATLWRF